MLNQSITSSNNIEIAKNKKWLFLLTLTLMSMAGLVGSDIYLPTLPMIGQALQQNQHAMQFTLGIYLFGLSIGQIIFGPLTDRYGRKKLLIIGMLLYLLSSLSCAISFSYYQLIISRLLQALGACSGLVIGRAIVGDLYDAKEAGKIFSTVFPFVGMSPAISPVIGGLIGHYFGWEMTFVFIALFVLLLLILIHLSLTETLLSTRVKPLNLIKIISTYPKVFTNRKFLLYASAPCIAYIAYFAYIAQSPFIFYAHGFGAREIGMFYITLSLTYVGGNLLGKQLLKKNHIDYLIKLGYLVFTIGAVALVVTGVLHFPLLIMVFSISILTFGNGFLIPLGTAGVVTSFSNSIGYASGLLGFLQLGSAALSSSLIGAISFNSVTRLGVYILFVALAGIFINIMMGYNMKKLWNLE